jgi:hypothetical protein
MANQLETLSFSQRFATLVEDLYIMSETDARMTPFEWKNVKNLSEILLRKKAKATDSVPLEEWSVEDFFRNHVTPQDWHGEEEKASVTRFNALVSDIQQSLLHPTVYKIGEVKKEVFVVGQLPNGNFAGLKTIVVES